MNNLPEISDGKSAAYNDEPIMGRAFPLKTYSHSENRSISMTLHFYAIKKADLQDPKNKRNIVADAALKKVFGGKAVVNMFEMTKLVSKHLS